MDTLQPITWPQIKANRNRLLVESDWTQLHDTVLSSEERAAWQAYRQALRDIPQNFKSPEEVIWPEKPMT